MPSEYTCHGNVSLFFSPESWEAPLFPCVPLCSLVHPCAMECLCNACAILPPLMISPKLVISVAFKGFNMFNMRSVRNGQQQTLKCVDNNVVYNSTPRTTEPTPQQTTGYRNTWWQPFQWQQLLGPTWYSGWKEVCHPPNTAQEKMFVLT